MRELSISGKVILAQFSSFDALWILKEFCFPFVILTPEWCKRKTLRAARGKHVWQRVYCGKTWLKIEAVVSLAANQSEGEMQTTRGGRELPSQISKAICQQRDNSRDLGIIKTAVKQQESREREREKMIFLPSLCTAGKMHYATHFFSAFMGPQSLSHTHTPTGGCSELWMAQGEITHSITPGSHCTMLKKKILKRCTVRLTKCVRATARLFPPLWRL